MDMPCTQMLYDYIERTPKGNRKGTVFINPLTKRPPKEIKRAWNTAKKKAGIENFRFHDLRHTFTSHAANSGIAPKTLSEIVGHTKASFTLDTYAHVTSDMQKNASHIVTNYITDILGKELKPWEQSDEKVEKEQ